MWRPERWKPVDHSVRNRLIAAAAVVGGLAATAFGVYELGRRGRLGERAQSVLGGTAIGENATVDTVGLDEPQTATAANMGGVADAGAAEVGTRFAEPGSSERRVQ